METKVTPKLDASPTAELLPYEPPTVTTYTDEQLLEALGPAEGRNSYLNKPGQTRRWLERFTTCSSGGVAARGMFGLIDPPSLDTRPRRP
jgi:hypothetical protein